MPVFLWKHTRLIGIAAIAVSLLTWISEFMGVVYECPYCRVQRTVIGLLGLLVLLPRPFHWTVRYLASVIGAFGFSVGSTQHFGGWRRMMAGEFTWGEQWYVNSWLLSACALFMISGLVLLIWAREPET